jgi:signal transduction histidine kinase
MQQFSRAAAIAPPIQGIFSQRSRQALAAWFLCAVCWTLLLGTVLLIAVSVLAFADGAPLMSAYSYIINGTGILLLDTLGYTLSLATLVTFATLGALIVSRHPRHAIGWIFCSLGLFGLGEAFAQYYAIYGLLVRPGALPFALVAAWVTEWTWVVFFGLLCIFLPLLFPTGHLLSPRWRPVGWFAGISIIFLTLAFAVKPGPLGNITRLSQVDNPLRLLTPDSPLVNIVPVGFVSVLVSMLIAAATLIVRLFRATGDERQQLKWFCYPTALLAILFVLQGAVRYGLGIESATFETGYRLAWAIVFSALPIATSIAILKHRLYDIDLVINRTLVYGGLSTTIIGIYVLVVGALSAAVQARGNLLISLAGAGLVAVLFQPLREWFQRGANRLMYGERDEPYAALSRLGQRLEAAIAPETVLPTIVQTVQETLKLPYVAIALDQDGICADAASVGTPVAGILSLPLVYQGETIGQLLLGPRAPREPFNPADLRLLEDIAHQAGVAAHAVRLTTDLQRSRERLVAAREEERRRLRRDLHDGLGPSLATQTLKLEAARDLIHSDPASAETLLSDLIVQSQAAIVDIRRLVYALRPPALDELGFIGAIHEQMAQYEPHRLTFSIDVPERLPPLPAAVEVAAYRIVQEALTNVARHAQAHACTIHLTLDDEALCLEISDDGRGLPAAPRAGVGLNSMRERAAELGGTWVIEPAQGRGTRVRARLPLR